MVKSVIFLGMHLYLEGFSKIEYASSKYGYTCDVIVPKYRRKWLLCHFKKNVQEMKQSNTSARQIRDKHT